MGLNDAAEMLEVAKEQAVADERTIARLRSERDTESVERLRLQQQLDAIRALCDEAENDRTTGTIGHWELRAVLDAEPAPTAGRQDQQS
jgi:hypothetical protein